jgi:glucose/arabinose dehydrogenase
VAVPVVGERGLLGVVLDPDFAANGHVYIYYTTAGVPMHNRVSRFTAAGNVVVPGSEVVLLDLPPIDLKRLPFHNGGGLQFGPDGKLYVGVGDHEDPRKAQDINSPFGKVLRINKDGTIPRRQPALRPGAGPRQGGLGPGAPQSLHVRLPARDRPAVRQ